MRFIYVLILMFLSFGCGLLKRETTVSREAEYNNLLSNKDSLAIELIELYGSDQIARRDNRVILALDSINFEALVKFVIKNGFPREGILGKKYLEIEAVELAAVGILLHSPHRLVNQPEYLNLFLEEVNKGHLDRHFLATVLDKYYWLKRDEQGNRRLLYGTTFGKPCAKYRKESDSARAVIGLNPLPDSAFVDCK